MVQKLNLFFGFDKKKYYIPLCFLIVVFHNSFFGEIKAAAQDTNRSSYHSIIYVIVSPVFEMSRSDFFDVYNSDTYLGGNKTKFSPQASLGIGTKIDFMDNYRFGAEVTYIRSSLDENISQPVIAGGIKGYRQLIETFNFNSMPVIITGEYIPYDSQFRTYVGLGLGVNVASTSWSETLKFSPIEHDKRTGGQLLEETDALPLLRLYAGLDLGFDKLYKNSFLGSLILEVRYTKFFSSIDMFSKFRTQYGGDSPELSAGYLPIPDYLEMAVSVSFNFQIGKQIKKK